jgi:nitrite reductase/ring-hydroxylating ferredoxin subunit
VGLPLPPERLDESLFWDTSSPSHYVRTVAEETGEPILLVGGEDHRTGTSPHEDPFRELIRWARERLGVDGNASYRWSGQILVPHDGLALIGRIPGGESNTYVVTGHSGSGLTYGTLAARIIADLLKKRENSWAGLYDPSRINIINLKCLGAYLSENAASTAYYADWFTPGDVESIDNIPSGEGAILRDGVQKIAVYRDDRGRPHFFSASCPHRNGVVRWNAAEKTWDCPCHGSRFDRLGHVLNGPATTGLRAIADDLGDETECASA